MTSSGGISFLTLPKHHPCRQVAVTGAVCDEEVRDGWEFIKAISHDNYERLRIAKFLHIEKRNKKKLDAKNQKEIGPSSAVLHSLATVSNCVSSNGLILQIAIL